MISNAFKNRKFLITSFMILVWDLKNLGPPHKIDFCRQDWVTSPAHRPHSVLERIWIKGCYLSQWLPQGERWPPKESKSWWIEILHIGPTNKFFFQSFFRLRIFFFRNKKNFFKQQLLFSFLCIVKQKKNFGVIRKILKNFDFQKS